MRKRDMTCIRRYNDETIIVLHQVCVIDIGLWMILKDDESVT